MRCVGGEVGATSSLAPKIGPLGLVSIMLYFKRVKFIGYHFDRLGYYEPIYQLVWSLNYIDLSQMKLNYESSTCMCTFTGVTTIGHLDLLVIIDY